MSNKCLDPSFVKKLQTEDTSSPQARFDASFTKAGDVPKDGWNEENPGDGGDCRKLVTLRDGNGMIWVGIRAWTGTCWHNNGVRQPEEVLAWRELPPPAYSDGLMNSMSGPTLPAGDG